MRFTKMEKSSSSDVAPHSLNEKQMSEENIEDSELDGIHDGLVFPTEEERKTLRRVADTIPWNAYRETNLLYSVPLCAYIYNLVIAFVELAERFSVCKVDIRRCGVADVLCSFMVPQSSS